MSRDVVALMKTKVIEARTKEEQKIEQFAKSISSVNIKEVFGDTPIPTDISLRAMCPEAYEETPNPDVYEEQFNSMVEVFEALNEKIIAYNGEAMEAIQQFKLLS